MEPVVKEVSVDVILSLRFTAHSFSPPTLVAAAAVVIAIVMTGPRLFFSLPGEELADDLNPVNLFGLNLRWSVVVAGNVCGSFVTMETVSAVGVTLPRPSDTTNGVIGGSHDGTGDFTGWQ